MNNMSFGKKKSKALGKSFAAVLFTFFGMLFMLLMTPLALKAQSEIFVKVALPADAKGNVSLEITNKDGKVISDFYKIDEGVVEIFLGDKSTGTLEIEPNSKVLYIGDLQAGETLKVKSLKMTDLHSFSAVYIENQPLNLQ